MDFGSIDPVAIYAAIVSTIALGWQIQKERRARRPQVEVKLSYSLLTYPDRPGAVGVARLEARNRGDMPIRVASAGCEPSRSSVITTVRANPTRLRRGWLGVFVITGYFSEAAQREVLDDQYPLVLVHGLRVAEEVLRLAFERHGADVGVLLKEVDATYPVRLQIRRPEEILWD